jgi:hypothetical protein
MTQGVKAGIPELRDPCKKIIDKFEKDAKGSAFIISCGDDVLKNVDKKLLIEINGKLPEVASHTFENIDEFLKEKREKGGSYKYKNTKITFKHVNLYNEFDKVEKRKSSITDYRTGKVTETEKTYVEGVELDLKDFNTSREKTIKELKESSKDRIIKSLSSDFMTSQKIENNFNNHLFFKNWISVEKHMKPLDIKDLIDFVIPQKFNNTLLDKSRKIIEIYKVEDSYSPADYVIEGETVEVTYYKDFEVTGYYCGDYKGFIVTDIKAN